MQYSTKEVSVIRECGQRLSEILREVVAAVAPGVTTIALDALARRAMDKAGGEPSFLGYRAGGETPFPSALCISINNEVVHGPAVPSRTLSLGDIVGIDIGMRYPAGSGFCTDMAMTVPVGRISADAARLLNVTRQALVAGVAAAKPNGRIGDIGKAVEACVTAAGYSIVRELVGHGVGREVHEAPEVPNFSVRGPLGAIPLVPGLVIAIEPMVTAGKAGVQTLADDWTVVTRDGSLSAHFEQTIVISAHGAAEVLTPFL